MWRDFQISFGFPDEADNLEFVTVIGKIINMISVTCLIRCDYKHVHHTKVRRKYLSDAKSFYTHVSWMFIFLQPKPIKSNFMWSILLRLTSFFFFHFSPPKWNAKATSHLSNSLKRIPKVSRHMPNLHDFFFVVVAFFSFSFAWDGELVKCISDRLWSQFSFNWCV